MKDCLPESLPPHDDVKEGLQLLKDAGFRLVTLTNSAPDTLQQQLKNGLTHYFEANLSVDEFKLYNRMWTYIKKRWKNWVYNQLMP